VGARKGCVSHAVTPYGRNGPSSRVRVFEWLHRIAEPYALSSCKRRLVSTSDLTVYDFDDAL
jgi:hypothetical protein